MAGKGQRGSRYRGQSSRHGSLAALAATVSAGGPGTEATSPTVSLAPARGPVTAPTPDEAANLTAFLDGLPTSDLHWTLPQLNQLLFRRQLQQTGRFGDDDGGLDLPA